MSDDLKKQFYLISFSEYYPSGGLGDVRATFDKLDDAVKACNDGSVFISSTACYIFDRTLGEVVFDLYASSGSVR
jgi:hypothetical protein